MAWENIGIAIAAFVIFLYNEYKRKKEKKGEKEKAEKAREEIKGVVRSEIKKANGVPFAFVQNSPLPMWCKDTDGRMIWINETYTMTWGIKSVEYEGRLDADIWGEEIAKSFRLNDLTVIMEKTTLYTRESVPKDRRKPQENIEDWHIWEFPVFDSEKKVIAVGGIAKKVIPI